MSTAEKFRRKFRQKRRFLEVTQREIGKAVGYTQVSICRFE
ncbi:MAG: hypothetical protein GTN39_01915, partial [Candidatus Aenigmarchaeota archaeon]|nr:hypothetical protein [Candidatus Aenigmarchaeota archaeon]